MLGLLFSSSWGVGSSNFCNFFSLFIGLWVLLIPGFVVGRVILYGPLALSGGAFAN